MRDSLAIAGVSYQRYVRMTIRSPKAVIAATVQPVVYLFLFGPVLTGLSNLAATPEGAYDVYLPGLLIQQALFGAAFSGLSLMSEFRLGVLERLLATPLDRTGWLAGRVLRDVTVTVAQCVLLLVLAPILGARFSLLAALVALGLAALVAIALSSCSYLIAVKTRDEGTLSNVFNIVLLPVLLLSGAMIPVTLGPTWLVWASRVDPASYVVNGARQLFTGEATWVLGVAYAVAVAGAVVSFVIARRALDKA